MFRFLVVGAGLAHAQHVQPGCSECEFDLTKLEEMTLPFETVAFDLQGVDVTSATPESFPQEHGSIAVHVRNLQLKADSHVTFPEGMTIGPIPVGGQTWDEEIHINGVTNQVSWHLDTSLAKFCVLIDAPSMIPPASQLEAAQMSDQLDQAEQMAPQIVQAMGVEGTFNGEDVVLMLDVQNDGTDIRAGTGFGRTDSEPKALFIHQDPHDIRMIQQLMNPPPHRHEISRSGVKFTGYSNSAGDVFSTRACAIGSQSSTLAMFEANPHMKQYVKGRLDQRMQHLQGIVHPHLMTSLVVPSDLGERFVALVDAPTESPSNSSTIAVALVSFVMGVAATFGGMKLFGRKKPALAELDGA